MSLFIFILDFIISMVHLYQEATIRGPLHVPRLYIDSSYIKYFWSLEGSGYNYLIYIQLWIVPHGHVFFDFIHIHSTELDTQDLDPSIDFM